MVKMEEEEWTARRAEAAAHRLARAPGPALLEQQAAMVAELSAIAMRQLLQPARRASLAPLEEANPATRTERQVAQTTTWTIGTKWRRVVAAKMAQQAHGGRLARERALSRGPLLRAMEGLRANQMWLVLVQLLMRQRHTCPLPLMMDRKAQRRETTAPMAVGSTTMEPTSHTMKSTTPNTTEQSIGCAAPFLANPTTTIRYWIA